MGATESVRIDVGELFTLEPGGYPGVVVTASPATSLRELFSLKKIGEYVELKSEADLDALDAALKRFGDQFIKGWNVNLQGKEVEPTGDGLLSLPTRLQFEILKAWLLAAQGGIEVPLAPPSRSGPDSPTPSTDEPASE